jgi:hypothetical protein
MTNKNDIDELIERIDDIIEGAKDFDGLITPIGETFLDCKVELQQLKAIQESKWQPIETAPKDTWIIVGREDDEIAIASDYIYIGVSGIPKYIGWVSNSYDERGERESLWFEPTHWQPLLEPPKQSKTL